MQEHQLICYRYRSSYYTTMLSVIWQLCSVATADILTMPMQPRSEDGRQAGAYFLHIASYTTSLLLQLHMVAVLYALVPLRPGLC